VLLSSVRCHLRLGLLVAVALGFSMPATVFAAVSPAKVLASILAAARAERSVHYVSATSIGVVRIHMVGDAGATKGIQHITFRKGTQMGHITVIVSANTAYVRGDAFTLVNFMGFKAAAAVKNEDIWVRIPPTDTHYSIVAAGVTLPLAIAELELAPVARVAATKIGGQQVIGVKGTTRSATGQPAQATLYGRAAGPPLPVQDVVSQGSARATVTFSNWNGPIHVATPTGAVPIATSGLE
jgi:hypothetical protein